MQVERLDSEVVAVSMGSSCALTRNGTLWCWERTSRLSDAGVTTTSWTVPVQLPPPCHSKGASASKDAAAGD
jgi:hypothetical protein